MTEAGASPTRLVYYAGEMGGLKLIRRAGLLIALVAVLAVMGTGSAAAATAGGSGSLVLYIRGAFSLRHQQVTVPGRAVNVDAIEAPYVAGQWVKMLVYLNGHLLHTYGLQIQPGSGGNGSVSYGFKVPRTGKATVVVTHAASAQLGAFSARHHFSVISDQAGPGARGPFVQLIQERLAALHFYTPQTGVYDQGTGLAIDAYHRLLHWGTSQTLDSRTVNALLNGTGQFAVHDPGDGKHAEGNLSDQLLALINGSQVAWIFPISSGKPSTPTILGHFHVYSKVPGYLPDGMFDSNFFYTGYAIHGYNPAPDYAASHGCMRLPIVDAPAVFGWLQMGNAVDVYN